VFVFVTDPAEVPDDATPFDMRGVALGHHGPDCTFETILRRYDLTDPVLWKLGAIVHEADLDDERYDAPEAPGLDVVLRGLSMICDDAQILELSRSSAPTDTPAHHPHPSVGTDPPATTRPHRPATRPARDRRHRRPAADPSAPAGPAHPRHVRRTRRARRTRRPAGHLTRHGNWPLPSDVAAARRLGAA
jgi:hypothetical protein